VGLLRVHPRPASRGTTPSRCTAASPFRRALACTARGIPGPLHDQRRRQRDPRPRRRSPARYEDVVQEVLGIGRCDRFWNDPLDYQRSSSAHRPASPRRSPARAPRPTWPPRRPNSTPTCSWRWPPSSATSCWARREPPPPTSPSNNPVPSRYPAGAIQSPSPPGHERRAVSTASPARVRGPAEA
jgi:hypothetical protein